MNFWSDYFFRPLLLMVPLIVAGIAHMIVVKVNLLPSLARPIHLGLFGRNKTYRGLVFMPFLTVPGVYLARMLEANLSRDLYLGLNKTSPLLLGILLGLAYIAAELPNSYLKRRLGIQEGNLPERNRWFFLLLDQADSAIGCILVYHFLLNVGPSILVASVLLGTAIHLLFNFLLYLAGIRKRPC